MHKYHMLQRKCEVQFAGGMAQQKQCSFCPVGCTDVSACQEAMHEFQLIVANCKRYIHIYIYIERERERERERYLQNRYKVLLQTGKRRPSWLPSIYQNSEGNHVAAPAPARRPSRGSRRKRPWMSMNEGTSTMSMVWLKKVLL